MNSFKAFEHVKDNKTSAIRYSCYNHTNIQLWPNWVLDIADCLATTVYTRERVSPCLYDSLYTVSHVSTASINMGAVFWTPCICLMIKIFCVSYCQNQMIHKVHDDFRDMLAESIDSVGGYHSDVFVGDDHGALLAAVHNKTSPDLLNIQTVQTKLKCLKIQKVEELVVNETSNMRDLNIAVLMTHWDHIAPVYYHRLVVGVI